MVEKRIKINDLYIFYFYKTRFCFDFVPKWQISKFQKPLGWTFFIKQDL